VPLAVRAASRLVRRCPSLRLLVIGDGPARAEIERAVVEAGLGDRVVMTGYRDDAAVLVAALDLFLLPSRTEGTSLALVSAMAAGVPAIASRVGGTPEVLVHGRTGLLVPSEDEDALVAAMGDLLADPVRRHQMGEAARQVYLARFTYEGMLSAFQDLYRELGA